MTKTSAQRSPVASNAKRRHVSVYLTPLTLKRIELLRTQLIVDDDRRLSRSDLIERAILIGLAAPKKLVDEA